MIRQIITDQFILSQKSTLATKEDLAIVQDLLDTIKAHETHCVGMAADMIGFNKRIIVIKDNDEYLVMINPEIINLMGRLYEGEEGCLSHSGTRKTKRYEKIKVAYYDKNFKKKIKTFNDYSAQIIQHEIDHCNGILI